jgi:hypothetical protein
MIRVVHPGSRIRMLTFYPSRIPDPVVKKAPDPASRIRIRNTVSANPVFYRICRYRYLEPVTALLCSLHGPLDAVDVGVALRRLHLPQVKNSITTATSVSNPDPDPYSIGSADPNPDWESGYGAGSKQAKIVP